MTHPRGNSSQMDFDYDNKIGPVRLDSAFSQAIHRNQPQSSGGQIDGLNKKRPYSAFESPSKSTSAFGNLRSPSGDSIFSNPTQPGADVAFMTPRVSREAEIPSSGPETSPDNHADSEATPDTSRALVTLQPLKPFTSARQTDGQHSPLFKFSSGRGEIRHHVTKRRRKDSDKERRKLHHKTSAAFHDSGSSADERSPLKPSSKSQQSQHKSGIIPSILDYLHDRPTLPATLSRYAQLALNIALITLFLSILYRFTATISADIDKKAAEARADVLAQIAQCAKSFTDNHCEDVVSGTLAPALRQPCAEWRHCMDRDEGNAVGRARVSAHTLAEIFNEFVEPISWKAFAFVVVICSVCLLGANVVFVLFRSRLGGAPVGDGQHRVYPQGAYGQGGYHGYQQMGYTPGWNEQGMYAGQPYLPQTPGRGRGYEQQQFLGYGSPAGR